MECHVPKLATKVKMSQQEQKVFVAQDDGDQIMTEEQVPDRPLTDDENDEITEPQLSIQELLGINHDSDEDRSFKETFSLPQALFPVKFHPSNLQALDAEHEEEMIRIVNTNPHVHNGDDGGRARKLRHISKI